jgi:LysR family nitrogen assimilation transcriptional regulator
MAESKKLTTEVTLRGMRKVIDSRRLLYFYHVAKAGRFTAAEAVLDVAQSAMSRQIQQLEADLDVQLLERTGHGVKLTAFGQILFRNAEAILQSMSATVDELDAARHNSKGSISIGAPPSFTTTYMADVIESFSQAHPAVRLCAMEASTGGVFTLLASGQVDIAIVLQTANTGRLVVKELMKEPLEVMAAPHHPIAEQKFVARAQLKELDLLLPASLYGSRAILGEYFAGGDIPLRSQIEVDSLPLMHQLLKRTPTCTILPPSACEAELEAGRLISRPLSPALSRTLYIAHLRDHPSSRLMHDLINSVTTAVRKRRRKE